MIFLRKLFAEKYPVWEVLQDMVDVHSHLLPGVDDGVYDRTTAIESLTWLYRQGVKAIWLTPHIIDYLPRNTPSRLKECMKDFHGSCPADIPELRLAGEYMLDAGFLKHLDEELLTLNGGKVLVETSYLSAPRDIDRLFHELFSSRYTPVVAHPERYCYMDKELFFKWKNRGCLFQLNVMSLAGVYGPHKMRTARLLLKNGMYDFLGSDIHQLKVYTRALERMEISHADKRALERLLDNNETLWV